jgi:hypothetical protein
MVVVEGERLIAVLPEREELWSIRTAGGPVAARVSCDRLVVSEPGRVSVLALESGEEEWRGKTPGEVVVAGDRLLVPGAGPTSLVYSLRDSAAKRFRTGASLGRPSAPGVRVVDGTLVPTVTGAGEVVLVDVADAAEASRAAPTTLPVETAWLAGPFLITTPPLSVSHLWGGIATTIPLDLDPVTGALVAGPGQALVRTADRSAWLEFS